MEPEPEQVLSVEHRRSEDGRARDRMAVHVVWEILLAVAVVGAVFAVRAEDAGALRGDSFRDLLVLTAAGILLGSGFALSLRGAVPNLAVGAAAIAAGTLTGWLVAQRGEDLRTAALITLGAAVAVGLALAIVVVGFRAPAWAAGLAAALGLWAAVDSMFAGRSLVLADAPDLRRWAWPLVGGALVLSAAGGLLGLVPGVREAVGRYRLVADPAARRDGGGFAATCALVGSTVLAAGAGLLLAMHMGTAVPDDGLMLLGQGVAVALLGGTSAHGRRGGVLGTALAAAFLQLAVLWLTLVDAERWTRTALLAGAIAVGLLVSRVVEAAGSPAEVDDLTLDGEPDSYRTGTTGAWESPYQGGGSASVGAYRRSGDVDWPDETAQSRPDGATTPFRPGSESR